MAKPKPKQLREELRIFDLLDKLRELSSVIDLSKLAAIFPAIQAAFDTEPALDAPGGIETRIREFVALASSVTAATKNPEDDKLVAALVEISKNDALLSVVAQGIRWLIDRGAREPDRMALVAEAETQVDVQPFVAAGIDPTTITTVISLLFKLFELFKAWRKKPAPA